MIDFVFLKTKMHSKDSLLDEGFCLRLVLETLLYCVLPEAIHSCNHLAIKPAYKVDTVYKSYFLSVTKNSMICIKFSI